MARERLFLAREGNFFGPRQKVFEKHWPKAYKYYKRICTNWTQPLMYDHVSITVVMDFKLFEMRMEEA